MYFCYVSFEICSCACVFSLFFWDCFWSYVCEMKLIIVLMLVFTGTPCFRGYGRRDGERRRKSVRGCIVSPDLSVLNLVIVKKGEHDLPGLTDTEKPRMRGPKRASKIRKLFNLSKEDDVRKYVNTYRRTFTTKTGESFVHSFYIYANVVTFLWFQPHMSRLWHDNGNKPVFCLVAR